MQGLLNELIVGNLFAFLLVFMRFGLALMIMPGVGDGFVTAQVRLLFALSFSFILMPVLSSTLPGIPQEPAALVLLMMSEATIGLFIGTIMRIMIGALDVAGTIISIQASFSNAFIFNPVTAVQGSVTGALYSMLGVTLLLLTDMHHMMLAALVNSYTMFPAIDALPDAGFLFETVRKAVAASFLVGVQLSMPFLIVGLVIQVGFGLLSRLMPQIQIFFMAQPVQIGISLIMIAMTLTTGMAMWARAYTRSVEFFLSR
jgi:flagellar biosynthesis protein FliR